MGSETSGLIEGILAEKDFSSSPFGGDLFSCRFVMTSPCPLIVALVTTSCIEGFILLSTKGGTGFQDPMGSTRFSEWSALCSRAENSPVS